MEPMAALRERGRWTRTAVLSMLAGHPGLSRSAIARRLGLTAQAVSVQVQEMTADGLLADSGGLHVTAEGIQRLQADAEVLTAATQRLRAPLAALDVVSAAAGASVRAGQPVGLWMRDGDLVADPREVGSSRGVAQNAATTGDEVRVHGLEGVVDHRIGTIEVLRVPEPAQGGLDAVDVDAIDDAPAAMRIGAVGTGAAILARRLGRLDIPFAAAHGALNAAQRGLDVRLYVSAEQVTDALRAIEAGDRGDRVAVRVGDVPRRDGR